MHTHNHKHTHSHTNIHTHMHSESQGRLKIGPIREEAFVGFKELNHSSRYHFMMIR